MSIDPENPIVKLCAKGIEEEMSGNIAVAGDLYHQAWEQKTSDFEAAIVAHYIARIQTTTEDVLDWNLKALSHADKVGNESVQAFYPSLYLNIGKAYEDMGDMAKARKNYESGMEKVNLLPDDPLGKMTREALGRRMERVKSKCILIGQSY